VSEPAAASTDAVEAVLSTIQGNVARLNLAARPSHRSTWLASLIRLLPRASSAHAAPGLDGILVRVEGFDSAVETDSNGSFVLRGGFSGTSIVRFEREDDGLDARLTVDVPKGGVLSLRDVDLDGPSGAATSDIQDLSFDGIIADKECLRRQLFVTSRFAPNGQRFVVELDGSTITDASGNPVQCIDLREGDDVHVDGVVRPNGAIGESTLSVDGDDRMREAAISPRSSLLDTTSLPGR